MSKKINKPTDQTLEDEQITWEQRYREQEQKSFEQWFDEAVKPYEIKELKEENQSLKETLEEKEKQVLPAHENAFIHNGDAWEILFKGKKLNPIKNLNGLTYIANLMLKPGKDIHVTDLCDSISHQNKEVMMSEDDLMESLHTENMSISKMQYDEYNQEDKKNITNALKDLQMQIREQQEIIDEPESLEAERMKAKSKKERLQKTLNMYGKKPLSQQPTSKLNESVKADLDRARKAIDRAIDNIRKQSPELADYLKKAITTGTQYSFTDTVTPWHISI